MTDPYEILGVSKTATQDEIRRSYRKLAKKYHPDLNPGKADAEQRFKDISAAHALLSDPEKRARFDRGEVDAGGAERPDRPFYRGFAQGAGGHRYETEEVFGAGEDLGSIFAEFFGGRGGAGAGGLRQRGGDIGYALQVDFRDAAKGTRRRVTLPDGRTLEVDLPAGLESGQVVRLKGQGLPGQGGGPPGDALIEVAVEPHPWFRREGRDIHLELPVTLGEAVLGAKVRVPTIDGPVTMTIPKGAAAGTVLRLKAKGIPDPHTPERRGDQYVTLRLVLPDTIDPELEAFVGEWAQHHPYDPRRAMEAAA